MAGVRDRRLPVAEMRLLGRAEQPEADLRPDARRPADLGAAATLARAVRAGSTLGAAPLVSAVAR